MRWSEPQLAMLREMGLRLWLAPDVGAAPIPAEPDAPPGVAGVARAAVAPGPAAVAAAAPPPDQTRPAQPATPVAPPAAARPVASRIASPAASPVTSRVASAVASPVLIDAADLGWPALREAVAGCRACKLCETRQQTVFGVGHPRAHCMVVGEAPGETEDARGEPFVGESGQLLDRMLRAIGLSREPIAAGPDPAADPARQVYIANALKCRPPRNRNPTPQELATCQPYLQRQVALVQPRVIIAMGRFAVQSLLGSDEPIGKLRGQVHRWRGVPLVVTYHPAYLLRQPAEKARAWDDLCLAADCLDRAPG